MQGAILAPALGEGDGHFRAIERRLEPIDRRRSFAVDLVWIDQHLFRFQIVRRSQSHEHRLLLGRLKLHRKQFPRPGHDRRITRRRFRVPRGELLLDRVPVRQSVEIGACLLVLRVRPRLHRRVVVVFQPLIVVLDFGAVIFVRDRFLLRGRCRLRSTARTFIISKPNIPETTNNRIFMVTQNNVRIDGARNQRRANLCPA